MTLRQPEVGRPCPLAASAPPHMIVYWTKLTRLYSPVCCFFERIKREGVGSCEYCPDGLGHFSREGIIPIGSPMSRSQRIEALEITRTTFARFRVHSTVECSE